MPTTGREFGLLDLTLHYAIARRSSVYLTLPAVLLHGRFFSIAPSRTSTTDRQRHPTGGISWRVTNSDRPLVEGLRLVFLRSPIEGGLGDPSSLASFLAGAASHLGVRARRSAKFALRGERSFLSTGSNDYGLQGSLQGSFAARGSTFHKSRENRRPRARGQARQPRGSALTTAYEVGLTGSTSFHRSALREPERAP